jgi:WD40 repeat protein
VTIVDLRTHKQKPALMTTTSAVRGVEFTPDGKQMLAFDNLGNVLAFDPEHGKELRKITSGPSQAFPAVAADSKTVITVQGNVVDQWKLESGEPVHAFDGHRAMVANLAVSPDGRLACSCGPDNTLRLWELASGRQVHWRKRPTYAAASVAFTPDGEQLLWASAPTTIERLDVADLIGQKKAGGAQPRELRGNQFATFAIADNGRTIVANNSAGGGTQIWDLTKPNPTATTIPPTFGAQGTPLAFSPDARLSATPYSVDGSGKQIVIADLVRGREVTRLVSPPNQQLIQGVFVGNRLFASRAIRQIALWDLLSGRAVFTVSVDDPSAVSTAVTSSSDGRLLAWAEGPQGAGESGHTIRLYDSLAARDVGRFSGHLGAVQSLRLHMSGDQGVLLSGGQDSTVLVWDLQRILADVRKATPELTDEHADRVWADLGAEDAGAMHRASWLLASAKDKAVRMLAERLQPAPVDPALGEKIERLVRRMDDDLFSVREQASQEAAELGEAAEPYLQEALKQTTSAEVRHRIRRLLNDITGKPIVLSSDQQRAIRAVQVLEQIGGPEARGVLERLTTGQPSARLTQEAKSALSRLAETERQQ